LNDGRRLRAAVFVSAITVGSASAAAQTIYQCGFDDAPRFSDVRDHASCRAVIGNATAAAPGHGRRSQFIKAEDKARWMPAIRRAEDRYGLPSGLFAAVVATESAFRPAAVSPKGAIGLAQLMPATARELGVRDPFEPHANLDGGARHLRLLLDRYDGNVELALAAYNAGQGAVARFGNVVPPYAETRAYVHGIQSTWRPVSARPGD
jgi:soluble lytic murein transglycosylase-like protein